MIHPFLERLTNGPLLVDGAMGTLLYARGIPYERCFDELNLSEPNLVQQIHREYIAAGAEVVETNTFGANRFKLGRFGLEHKVRDINFRGVKIAREAREVSGEPVLLAGAVGPIGQPLAPIGGVSLNEARAGFREQIEALLEAGADLLMLETFPDLEELRQAVLAAREVCELPIVAQVTFADDGQTLTGAAPAGVATALLELQVAVLGVNCGLGPQLALDVVHQMAVPPGTRLSALPNAGFPSRLEGRYLYFSTPDYFADYARRFAQAGVSLIGGCCGTTPQHTAAMRKALDELRPADAAPRAHAQAAPRPAEAPEPPATEGPTPWMQKLEAGKFVVSVELDPPKGLNPTRIVQGAEFLAGVGVDAINIGDSPMARVRMSCIALAVLIQRQTNLDTIIHFTTRDRNLMALQSELLGAHALAIRNILALTGDPPRMGNYPNATGVWDVDSIGLVQILKQLNQGIDWAGNSIGRPASFQIACAVNPVADDLELELDRFQRKIEAGAEFAMTQPVYDVSQILSFLDRAGPVPIPIVLGVMPLQSHKHAEFLHNELPGVTIPDPVRERMRKAGEHGIAEGILQAQEFLAEAQRHVQGIYLMPSFGRYEMVAELVKVLNQPGWAEEATAGATRGPNGRSTA
jgi:methionine synthase I (cobalamin-dependent)/5,10-methylenetetrahydrofolate reductase